MIRRSHKAVSPRHRAALALLATASLFGAGLHLADAVVTATWEVDSYKELDKGEGENVLITSEGEVKPGWKTARVALEVDGTWSAVRASDGSVWIGTDDGGSILRVRGDKVSKLAAIEGAVAVVSLALGPDGAVYAGTMPGGEVWRVTAAGKTKKLATLDGAETVWSLAMAGDTLFAGTGPDGKLFAIAPGTGKATVAFDSEDKRIMALATADDGGLWLGTSDEALIYRYDPKSKTVRAMADFDGNEISALVAVPGGVVAANNNFTEPSSTGPRTARAAAKGTPEAKDDEGDKPTMPKPGTAPGADKAEPTNAKLPRKGARKGKGAVWRVDGDGLVEQLHALTDTYVASLAVDPAGRVLAGAGDKGRIYLIDTDDAVSTAFDVSERIVAQILADKSGVAFATADGAALYRADGAADGATYLSDVRDTDAPSQFGRILWHGSGRIEVETRTGNTATPGVGWSAWAAPRKVARGGGESRGGHIASPPGRYLQFRAKFAGDADAVLRRVAVYHLPANRPTKITEITIKSGRSGSQLTTRGGAAKPRSPVIEVGWDTSNPDKDTTVYLLAVRREGDANWRPLVAADSPVSKTKYEWNTETYPDGYYRLRVTATDRKSNTADRARQAHRTTPLFLVDNTKPTIAGVSIRFPAATARATDAMSAIAEAAYSIDDGPWQIAAPRDGLFDDLSELIELRIPKDLAPGLHTLAIRVADEAGNITATSASFRVGR